MRIICLRKEKLDPLLQVGAAIEDFTPGGIWKTQFHVVSMSDEQFAALKKLYGEPSLKTGYEDITPKIILNSAAPSVGFLYCRGGKIPNGTKLRAHYLSQIYNAEVRGSRVWLNQKSYSSPSEAARAITKTAVNGWNWWKYYDEQAGRWRNLFILRNQQKKTQVAA